MIFSSILRESDKFQFHFFSFEETLQLIYLTLITSFKKNTTTWTWKENNLYICGDSLNPFTDLKICVQLRSLNLKSPFPTGYLKSGVPTIKPFLRQESGLFNSYKWMYIRQYGLSLFSLNVIAGISNVYIVSHHSKGMFINKKLIFSIIP